MTVGFCPNCGADITLDQPIMLNDFSMFGPSYPLCYRGKPIAMTPAQRLICWSLLKAYPRIVNDDALLIRCGSVEAESNVLDVQISRLRSRLRAANVPNPIATVRHGYQWSLTPPPVVSNGGGRPKK